MNRIASTLTLVGGVGVVVGGVLLCPQPASARNEYLAAFRALYPSSTLPDRMFAAGSSCLVCHHDANDRRAMGNCYREDLIASFAANPAFTIEQHLQGLEGLDSDGDGVSNLDEILAPRPDGVNIGYNPGFIGDLGTDPCSMEPAVAVTGESETPSVATCPCELDGDAAQVNVFDLLAYLNLWFPGDAGADIDGTAGVDVFDLLFFLNCWFPASAGSPCP